MRAVAAETERLVEGFSQAAFERNAAWFIGAGVSRPSGLMTWMQLLRPLAKELDVELNAHDDLPAIAQYYINKSSGNRGPLVQHLKRCLDVRAEPSTYHLEIARSSAATIWTTNYDRLMEDALSGLRTRVRARESDFVELTDPGMVEVIKAHGSFGVSDASEFVIASEDYEDYAQRRPAMIARLRADLLTKSFLFVGYGYGDPNIRTVMVEARRLSQKAMLPHWMLSVAAPPDKVEEGRRQQLWKADLERIGIRCVLVENYEQVEHIVARVARRSRGPTIYVTGAHGADDPRAADIGRRMASPEIPPTILLDGQSTGVSRTVLSAFQETAVQNKLDLNERLRFYPNPYAANPRFSNDPSLLPVLKQWRGAMLRQAHTVLAFDGGMGTRAETAIAFDLGCCIVPVPFAANGSALALLDEPKIAADLDRRAPGYVKKAKALMLTAQDVVECLLADMPKWQ